MARRLPALSGAMRVLAFAVLATAGLIAVHVLPAALYVLSREAVAITALLALAVCWRLPRVEGEATPFPVREDGDEGEGGRLPWALAAGTCLVVGLWLAANVWRLRYHAPQGIDTLSFHLPSVARWVQSGTLWQIDELLPDLFFGNYPNNGDMVLLASLLPWKNDFLTHFTIVPFLPLTTLAVYCLGRELEAPAPVALSLGAMVAAVPLVVQPALDHAMPDAVLFMSFAAGLAFLARRRRTGATSDLVLAGVALGIAFGTKWYGVSGVGMVIGVWAVGRLVDTRSLVVAVRETAALTGLVVAGGGVWLARNLILSGNPLFPLKVAPLGITIFDAPPDRLRDIVGATVFSYFDDLDVWQDWLLPGYRDAVGGPGVVVAVGFLVAAVLLVRRVRGRSEQLDGTVLAGLVLVGILVAVYVVTPYSALGPKDMPALVGANVRYVIPALIAAAGLTGWAVGRLGPGACLVAQLAALVAAVDGLRVSGIAEPKVVYACVAAAAVLVAVGWVLSDRGGARPRMPSGTGARAVGATALVVLALAVVFGGDSYQRNFNADRYVGFDPVLDWIHAYAPKDRKIGLAGVWTDRGIAPIYPAFGPQLGNEVVYNGPFVRELMTRYRTRRAFDRRARREGYDLMLVGRAPTFEQGQAGEKRLVLPEVQEERWAKAAGYREVARSDRFVLFRAPRGS